MRTTLLPLRVYSTLNRREHYMARARRTKHERATAFLLVPHHRIPCRVLLTYIGPRALDSDNVVGAMKAVRDGIADKLGVNDNSRDVEWCYAQQRGKPKQYMVGVQMWETL